MAYSDNQTKPIAAYGAAMRVIEIQRLKKATEHLLGICSGLIADARIVPDEIMYLRTWLSENEELIDEWPGRVIAQRLNQILDDGFITAAECDDLLQTLREITTNWFADTGAAAPDGPILPIDDDPTIFFKDMIFCLTGRFLWGTRASCERVILGLDGTVIDAVTQRLNYLVIGSMIEPQWTQTTYGRKIEKAVKYRDDGHDIVIISEKQWTAAIEDITKKQKPKKETT